jgi:hypothetical protein
MPVMDRASPSGPPGWRMAPNRVKINGKAYFFAVPAHRGGNEERGGFLVESLFFEESTNDPKKPYRTR